MSTIAFDISKLYTQYFGTKPVVGKIDFKPSNGENFEVDATDATPGETLKTKTGSVLSEQYLGVEIWLPIILKFENGTEFYLPYATIRITGSKAFIRTSLAERKGSVKELFNIDDYKITIKGFLIDKAARVFPEDDLIKLKQFFETTERCFIQNAITDLFLEQGDAVVINSFELPEVEGGKKHIKPFVMQLESDSIFELIVK